jgi:hypothetical protein
VRVCVVLARLVVRVTLGRVGRKLFKPFFKVLVQTAFVVVDKHAGRDVHRVDKAQPFFDPAFPDYFRDLRRDVDKKRA